MKKSRPIKFINNSDEQSQEGDDSPSDIGMRASKRSQSQKLSSSNPNFGDSNSIEQFDQDQFDKSGQNDYQDSSNLGSSYMKQPKPRGRGRGRGRNRGRVQRGILQDHFFNKEQSFGLGRRGSRGRGRGRGGANTIRNTQRIINKMKDQQENQNIKKSSIFMQSQDSQESQEQNRPWDEDNQLEDEEIQNIDNFDNNSLNDDQFSQEQHKLRQKKQILNDLEIKNQRSRDRNELFIDSNEQDSDVEIQVQKLTQNSDKIRQLNNWKLKQYIKPRFQQGIKQIPILQPQKSQKQLAQQDLPQEKQTEQQTAELNQKRRKIRAYAEQFEELKTRRIMKYINGKFDLNVRTLHELVYDCYQQGLINEQLMLSIKNMGIGNYLEFTIKYKQQKLSQFDFQKVKFTLFDHRRLTKLLIEKGKKKQYTIEKPILFSPYQIHVFLEQVYALPQDVYNAFCQTLGQAYNLTWWKTIGVEQVIEQKKKNQQINVAKRNQAKRIRYKIKVNQEQNQQQQKKIVIQDRIDFQIKVQDESNRIKKQFIDQGQQQQDNTRKIKKSDKQSAVFSSLLDSQAIIQSSFSISSKTNSIQSDLFSDFGQQKQKKPRKKIANTKQSMQQKQMQKVKRSSINLKKVQQQMKNPSLIKKRTKKTEKINKITKNRKTTLKKQDFEQKFSRSKKKISKKGNQKEKDGFISDQNQKISETKKNQQQSDYDSDDI